MNIDFNRRTKLFAKWMPQKTMCHYNFKCKSRSAIVFSQKEDGRLPNDLGLCEEHAKEMLEALQVLYGKKDISVSEQALIDAAEALRLADETLNRWQALINLILDAKDKKLTWAIVESLLSEDKLEHEGVPNIKKGIEQYIAYHKPYKTRMIEAAAPIVEKEVEELDTNGIEDDLLTRLAKAAQAEGLGEGGEDDAE